MVTQLAQKILSIHAPTRGATANATSINNKLMLSIHAPTRGATRVTMFLLNALILSIHAPTRGATVSFCHSMQFPRSFNPRSYKRSDNYGSSDKNDVNFFQSTLLQEERRKHNFIKLW